MPSPDYDRASWDRDRSLLLILEADLAARFPYVEQVLCRNKHVLPLKNITRPAFLSTFVARFVLRHQLLTAYQQLKRQLVNYDCVFLSNTEGFIARNIERWIRRDFPEMVLLHLQHGLMVPEPSRLKRLLLAALNRVAESGIDYSLAGEGFVGNPVDYYIVCNNHCKALLVQQRASRRKIVVSSLFVKGEKYGGAPRRSEVQDQMNCAVFFLQCLSALAITDRQAESSLIQAVIQWLSQRHERVLLKQHPYGDIEVEDMPANCRFVKGDVAEIAQKCSTAVSFFSEALLECEHLGLRTMAIRSRELIFKPGTYDFFAKVLDVQPDGSITVNRNVRNFTSYYETEVNTADALWEIVAKDTVRSRRPAPVEGR